MPSSEHLIRIRETYGIDLNWLLTGEEIAEKVESVEKCDDNKPLHSVIIERFKNKELARDISYELLNLEEKNPYALKEIIDFIRFKVSTIQSNNNPDRRKGERRLKKDPERIPGGKDRRSGQDRRKAAGGDH